MSHCISLLSSRTTRVNICSIQTILLSSHSPPSPLSLHLSIFPATTYNYFPSPPAPHTQTRAVLSVITPLLFSLSFSSRELNHHTNHTRVISKFLVSIAHDLMTVAFFFFSEKSQFSSLSFCRQAFHEIALDCAVENYTSHLRHRRRRNDNSRRYPGGRSLSPPLRLPINAATCGDVYRNICFSLFHSLLLHRAHAAGIKCVCCMMQVSSHTLYSECWHSILLHTKSKWSNVTERLFSSRFYSNQLDKMLDALFTFFSATFVKTDM